MDTETSFTLIGVMIIFHMLQTRWARQEIIEAVKVENDKMLRRLVALQHPTFSANELDLAYQNLVVREVSRAHIAQLSKQSIH